MRKSLVYRWTLNAHLRLNYPNLVSTVVHHNMLPSYPPPTVGEYLNFAVFVLHLARVEHPFVSFLQPSVPRTGGLVPTCPALL